MVFSALAITVILFNNHSEGTEEGTQRELVQELFLGELAAVQKQGEFQITLGAAYVKKDIVWQAPLSFEFGITDRFQIAAELAGQNAPTDDRRHTHLGYWGLELAHALRQTQNSWLTVGLEGSEEHDSEEGIEFELFAALSQTIGKGLFNLDFGYGEEEEQITLAGVFPIQNWMLTSEVHYHSEEDEDATHLAPGLTRIFGEWEIALGIPINLKDTDQWEVVLMLTIELD